MRAEESLAQLTATRSQNGQPPRDTWKLESAADIAARGVEPVSFDIETLLTKDDGPVLFFGAPGSLKTYLALHAAACTVTGDPFLGQFAVCKRPFAIYVNFDAGARRESEASLCARMLPKCFSTIRRPRERSAGVFVVPLDRGCIIARHAFCTRTYCRDSDRVRKRHRRRAPCRPADGGRPRSVVRPRRAGTAPCRRRTPSGECCVTVVRSDAAVGANRVAEAADRADVIAKTANRVRLTADAIARYGDAVTALAGAGSIDVVTVRTAAEGFKTVYGPGTGAEAPAIALHDALEYLASRDKPVPSKAIRAALATANESMPVGIARDDVDELIDSTASMLREIARRVGDESEGHESKARRAQADALLLDAHEATRVDDAERRIDRQIARALADFQAGRGLTAQRESQLAATAS